MATKKNIKFFRNAQEVLKFLDEEDDFEEGMLKNIIILN